MDVLFSERDTFDLLEKLPRLIRHTIESEPEDYLLNASETDLIAHYVSKYRLDVPELDEAGTYIRDRSEVAIDISGEPGRYFSTPGAHLRKGTQITIAVPFSGDAELFKFHPNQSTWSPPQAEIATGELRLVYSVLNQTGDEIKARYRGDIATITQWLGWLRDQLAPFNANLEQTVASILAERKQEILSNRNLVESIGLPIKARPGEATTYVVPDVRRKASVIAPKPATTRKPFSPELALDESTFEAILKIVKSMAHVMERSPSAFKTMGEEDLRQHFLLQLNAQFEGDASGETFNYDGKTDILIRRDDRNVFIAECKFWDGPKTINGTIDQILSYLSWRDTKAAIILFVRNKNFSAVLDQITSLVEDHPNHKKTLGAFDETDFRFVFGQRDDPNREIQFAVLVFPVPTE